MGQKLKQKQMSDSLTVGVLLAVVGGFLDAYTYLLRGHVFANAQTGNIVLLGFRPPKGSSSRLPTTCCRFWRSSAGFC